MRTGEAIARRARPDGEPLAADRLAQRHPAVDEEQLADLDRPAAPPRQRVAAEVFADVDGELADRQRVAGAAGDRDRPQPLLRRMGGGGDAGVGDVVDRDDVDPVRGAARQVGEAARRVGEDQRVGDLDPLQPARARLPQRRLDDRRPHDRRLRRAFASSRSPSALLSAYVSGQPSVIARRRPRRESRPRASARAAPRRARPGPGPRASRRPAAAFAKREACGSARDSRSAASRHSRAPSSIRSGFRSVTA